MRSLLPLLALFLLPLTGCLRLTSNILEENQEYKDAPFPDLNTVPEENDPMVKNLYTAERTEQTQDQNLTHDLHLLQKEIQEIQNRAKNQIEAPTSSGSKG